MTISASSIITKTLAYGNIGFLTPDKIVIVNYFESDILNIQYNFFSTIKVNIYEVY